jgi:hypothetical protein
MLRAFKFLNRALLLRRIILLVEIGELAVEEEEAIVDSLAWN